MFELSSLKVMEFSHVDAHVPRVRCENVAEPRAPNQFMILVRRSGMDDLRRRVICCGKENEKFGVRFLKLFGSDPVKRAARGDGVNDHPMQGEESDLVTLQLQSIEPPDALAVLFLDSTQSNRRVDVDELVAIRVNNSKFEGGYFAIWGNDCLFTENNFRTRTGKPGKHKSRGKSESKSANESLKGNKNICGKACGA